MNKITEYKKNKIKITRLKQLINYFLSPILIVLLLINLLIISLKLISPIFQMRILFVNILTPLLLSWSSCKFFMIVSIPLPTTMGTPRTLRHGMINMCWNWMSMYSACKFSVLFWCSCLLVLIRISLSYIQWVSILPYFWRCMSGQIISYFILLNILSKIVQKKPVRNTIC